MDAPPTQYRVIEQGRKLIVLDARTNLPPERAADMQPRVSTGRPAPSSVTGGEAGRRASEQAPARPPGSENGKGGMPNALERLADSRVPPAPARGRAKKITPMQIGAFGFAVFMLLGISIGGLTGFLVSAAAIIIAGNLAMQVRNGLS